MSIELKPCPFCGGEAEMIGDQYPYVECQECAGGFTANHSYDADEGDAASKWNARSNAGPKLKPIAESKVRQLGGDVCGALVRNEAGALAAVDEHGRVRRLGGEDKGGEYAAYLEGMNSHLKAELEAARTQSGQEVEPTAFGNGDKVVEVGSYAGKPAVFVAPAEPSGTPGELASPTTGKDKHRLVPGEWLMTFPTEKQAHEVADALCGRPLKKLYESHPQPAQQGSVPEGWGLHAKVNMPAPDHKGQRIIGYRVTIPEGGWPGAVDWLPNLTTPQPEGDGWIKCSERLPKLGQRVQLFSQGVIQHMIPVFDDSDDGAFWDFEVHDDNPPVDMNRDQWRPLPQPPQEGE